MLRWVQRKYILCDPCLVPKKQLKPKHLRTIFTLWGANCRLSSLSIIRKSTCLCESFSTKMSRGLRQALVASTHSRVIAGDWHQRGALNSQDNCANAPKNVKPHDKKSKAIGCRTQQKELLRNLNHILYTKLPYVFAALDGVIQYPEKVFGKP